MCAELTYYLDQHSPYTKGNLDSWYIARLDLGEKIALGDISDKVSAGSIKCTAVWEEDHNLQPMAGGTADELREVWPF